MYISFLNGHKRLVKNIRTSNKNSNNNDNNNDKLYKKRFTKILAHYLSAANVYTWYIRNKLV